MRVYVIDKGPWPTQNSVWLSFDERSCIWSIEYPSHVRAYMGVTLGKCIACSSLVLQSEYLGPSHVKTHNRFFALEGSRPCTREHDSDTHQIKYWRVHEPQPLLSLPREQTPIPCIL